MEETGSQELSYRDERIKRRKELRELSNNDKRKLQVLKTEKLRRLHKLTYESRQNRERYMNLLLQL